ncbi:MAG: urease subunit gamma [Nitrososphaeraceae archaeon]|jgi:urease gamma subunit
MIHVKAVIKGEPDTLPFTVVFQYADKSDEQIFCSSVEMIKEKLAKNLKINTNESLVIYCAYVVSAIRSHESVKSIENNGPKILSDKRVMIGVPETLRRITFEAMIDNFPKKWIILDEPIPLTNLW